MSKLANLEVKSKYTISGKEFTPEAASVFAESAVSVRVVSAKDYVPAMGVLKNKGYGAKTAARMLIDQGCPISKDALVSAYREAHKVKQYKLPTETRKVGSYMPELIALVKEHRTLTRAISAIQARGCGHSYHSLRREFNRTGYTVAGVNR